jgi:hypothetical protein
VDAELARLSPVFETIDRLASRSQPPSRR